MHFYTRSCNKHNGILPHSKEGAEKREHEAMNKTIANRKTCLNDIPTKKMEQHCLLAVSYSFGDK